MSSSTHYQFKKKPTSLASELLSYQHFAKEASKKGNQKLAARWNLAAELIFGFLEYYYSSNQSSITKLIEQTSINDRAIEAQEIAEYTTSSLTALMNNDVELAQKFISYTQETQEAGIRYRHWLVFLKSEIANQCTTQKASFDEEATTYRANALKATKAGHHTVAQHWAEAACLAQEAFKKQGLSAAAYVTSGNEFLSSHWNLSRDASHHAAKIKVKVALALEEGNPPLAQEYDNLALLAERLATYRENLVRALINGEMTTVPHWRSAAELLNQSLELEYILEKNQKDLPYQKLVIAAAQQAAERHSELISKLQKKKKYSLSPINFAEKSYQEAIKALQAFQADNVSARERAEKRTELYDKASLLSKKAADAKMKWHTLGIPFLYWMYQVQKVKRTLKKKSLNDQENVG